MRDTPAFACGATSSAFLGRPSTPALCGSAAVSRGGVGVGPTMMAEDKKLFGIIPNPFIKKKDAGGAAGSSGGRVAKKGAPMPVKTGAKLPVTGGKSEEDSKKRGLSLLAEDLLKTLPTRAGVGRQDVTTFVKPKFGEPGYKPQAYETVKYSQLGISSFSDDKNYVSKVGGIDAVKKAAKDAVQGVKASDIKKAVMKQEEVKEEPKQYPLPDYLRPLPEDTPRPGFTWKNY